ncbi:SUF system Fe-S cluster assembly protein [Paraherbaspirillum soli]|uniref:SUF system Fe-S cluster assembly protein n=1 Tax=Paraherbaspirillum soli TaxID=631222 RepID=A0ABW0MFA1_9BURK
MSVFDWLKKAEQLGEQELAQARPPATDVQALEQQVIQVLRTIYDPEIPVNIYDLGLIYALDVQASGAVMLRMTLTSAACPVAQTFPDTVECAVNGVPGVTEARVELVWEPPWTREMMSEAARLELGML